MTELRETAHPNGVQPGWRFLAPLLLVTASGPLSMQMILPALPALGRDFSASSAQTHLLVSLSLLSFGLAMLIWGPLADRFGRKLPLLAGTVLFAAGSCLALVATQMEMLIAGRILAASGSSAGLVLTRAMVRDVYPSERVASAISQLTMGQLIPPLMAPAIGGVLTDLFHWRMNFAVLAVVAVINVLLVMRQSETLRPEMRAMAGPMTGHRAPRFGAVTAALALLRHPRFLGVSVLTAGLAGAYFAFISGAPAVAVDHFGLSPTVYGASFIALSLSMMAGNMLAARFAPKFGPDRMMQIGMILSLLGAGVGLALALVDLLTLPEMMVAGAVLMFGNGFALSSAQSAAMAVDLRAAGAAAGVNGFFQMAAGAVFAQLTGIFHTGAPWPLLAMMTGTVAVGSLAYVALARR